MDTTNSNQINMAEHWRKLFDKDNKNLGAWDLEKDGKYFQVEVTIEGFYKDVLVGSMGTENKVFVKFKEYPKKMVCNATNFKRLQKLFDTIDKDVYVGKKVVLGVEKVKSPEGMVDALRFSTRPPVAKAEGKAKETITDDAFPKALESLRKGSTTVDKILAKYTVTEDQLNQMNDAVQG